MSDMRQKLLPVFLEEAGRKIEQLDGFFAAVGGEDRSLEDLETAFRAAHTLKGTAALVQAEAVRALSGRIEGILEGHFEKFRFPSDVEYEAMQLALSHLKLLIDAVARNIDEPSGLLIEAELALKLATAMPGRRPLAELLSPPGSIDPFADDPGLDSEILPCEDELMLAEPEDPFAEDDVYLLGPGATEVPVDLFGEDPAIEPLSAEPLAKREAGSVVGDLPAAESAEPAGPAVGDPFADDPDLDSSPVDPAPVDPAPVAVAPQASFAELNELLPGDSPSGGILVDPFADDPEFLPEAPLASDPNETGENSFIERMRQRIEKESALQTAERLSETLSRQDGGEAVARNYRCCRFRVGEGDYYLPIENMLEIADVPDILRLPLAPPVVKGLINLRGQVLPVIDLSVQAGTTSSYIAVRKLVIAEAGGETLAFLSDDIPDLSEEIQGERVDVINFIDQFRAGGS